MNKLSALIGDKTGKKTQYRIVEEATKGESQERVPFSSTSRTSSHSYPDDDDSWNISQAARSALRQRLLKGLVILSAILMFMELFYHRKTHESEDPLIITSAYRPCQTYSSLDTLQVIQTSLTNPSEHLVVHALHAIKNNNSFISI